MCLHDSCQLIKSKPKLDLGDEQAKIRANLIHPISWTSLTL